MKIKSKRGFSVAEAMITLLIVSVALAAMAPIMTKKAQNNMGGNSKWMYTRNGNDITRASGNVGIGVPQITNPSAKLHVKDGKILIENGSNPGLEIVYNGDGQSVIVRNTQNNSLIYIGTNKWNNSIVMQDGSTVTGYINKTGEIYQRTAAGDYLQTVPSAAIMAFDRDSCPAGWTPLTNTHGDAWGAFIRNVGGGAKVRGAIQYDAAPNITGVGPRFAAEIWNGAGLSGAIAWSENNWDSKGENGDGGWSGKNGWIFDASRSSSVYGRDGSTEIHPKNIAFLYCRKI